MPLDVVSESYTTDYLMLRRKSDRYAKKKQKKDKMQRVRAICTNIQKRMTEGDKTREEEEMTTATKDIDYTTKKYYCY